LPSFQVTALNPRLPVLSSAERRCFMSTDVWPWHQLTILLECTGCGVGRGKQTNGHQTSRLVHSYVEQSMLKSHQRPDLRGCALMLIPRPPP
jgi:hypothetical protein